MIAIYSRQSVEKKDSISIESQIDFCKKEILDENFKVYTDKGFSGKNINRPSFESMMNDVKTGLIEKVIVYKLDRISRSVLDFANIIEIFQKYKVGFISSTEKFDTSSPIGNAMLTIIMVFAQLERETIQKRIKDNYYARGRKGFYMGGRAPFGYSKIETRVNGQKTYTFENNIEQLPSLIKMYELYATTNMSLGKISDYFNNLNISAAEGGKWDSGKISRMLRSPVYVKGDADVYLYYKRKGSIISNDISDFIGENGCYLYGKRESNERKYTNVENHVLSIGLHQGVIDSDIWLKCQYKLDNNKQIKNSGKGKYTWLSGLVKCGYCNYAVSVITSGEYKYFNCRGKTNLKICKGHSIPIHVDKIEEIVEKNLFDEISQLRNIDYKLQDKDDINTNKIKLQIVDIDNQIDNLVKQIAESNEVVMKYINERISKLDTMKNGLYKELEKLFVNTSKSNSTEELLMKINNWSNLSLEEKKGVCSNRINKILIKDDEVFIDWRW